MVRMLFYLINSKPCPLVRIFQSIFLSVFISTVLIFVKFLHCILVHLNRIVYTPPSLPSTTSYWININYSEFMVKLYLILELIVLAWSAVVDICLHSQAVWWGVCQWIHNHTFNYKTCIYKTNFISLVINWTSSLHFNVNENCLFARKQHLS